MVVAYVLYPHTLLPPHISPSHTYNSLKQPLEALNEVAHIGVGAAEVDLGDQHSARDDDDE